MVEYLAQDEATRVICLFPRADRRPGRLRGGGRQGRQRGQAIIALKAGSSAAGQRAALAHTGSIARR